MVDTRALGPQGSGRKDVHMPRTRPPYPPEFRRQAIELLHSGVPIRQVAEELGVSQQTLRNWVRQGDIGAGRAEGLTTDEREELRRLRRENRRLTPGARDPQGGDGFLRAGDRSPVMCFRLIDAKRAQHPVFASSAHVTGFDPRATPIGGGPRPMPTSPSTRSAQAPVDELTICRSETLLHRLRRGFRPRVPCSWPKPTGNRRKP